jgi:hypothetical protein
MLALSASIAIDSNRPTINDQRSTINDQRSKRSAIQAAGKQVLCRGGRHRRLAHPARFALLSARFSVAGVAGNRFCAILITGDDTSYVVGCSFSPLRIFAPLRA